MSSVKGKNLLETYRRRRNRRGKQIVITAEKSETLIIRQQPRGSLRAWCGRCSAEIECLSVEQAVVLTGLSARDVFRLVETEGIHFCETADGNLFICPKSAIEFLNLAGPDSARVGLQVPLLSKQIERRIEK